MIKYRVYDTRAKKYLDRKAVSIDGNGVLKVDKCALGNIIRTPHSSKNPMFIIEQYTGLKDVHSKDIYEGDIVTYHPHHEGVPYKVYRADVSAKFLIGRKGIIGQELTGRIALEVIGNIHENAELLEAKDE